MRVTVKAVRTFGLITGPFDLVRVEIFNATQAQFKTAVNQIKGALTYAKRTRKKKKA